MLREQLVCIFIYLKSSFVTSPDPSCCLSSRSSAPRLYLDGEERAAPFAANTNPSRLNVWLTPVTPLLSNSTATQTEISFWQSDRTAITANARNWVFWDGEWEKKLKCPKNSLLPRLAYFLQLLLNYFSGPWRSTSTYRKAWRNELIPGILFSLQSRFLFVPLEDTLPCELEQTGPQSVDPNSANSPQLSMLQSGKFSFVMKIKPRRSYLHILSTFVFFFLTESNKIF